MKLPIIFAIMIMGGQVLPEADAVELRCRCLNTITLTDYSAISSLTIIPAGSSCSKTEVIATLKSGETQCINMSAAMIQTILKKHQSKNPQPGNLPAPSQT